jgi:hypothetical protein
VTRKKLVLLLVVGLVTAPLAYGLYLGFVPLSWGWADEYYSRAGVAIEGYDPVAYHTEGEAVRGNADLSLQWQQLEWHFSSAAHRAQFEADPYAFAPEFGGYCSKAVSSGFSGGGNPRVWHVDDGKLYFFFSTDARENWLAELDTGIKERSQANWAGKK